MVTDEQVRLLRRQMTEGKTMATAAAVAGMSERAARKWKQGALPSATKQPRHWRTRQDPFESVWEAEVVPLLERDEAGVLECVFRAIVITRYAACDHRFRHRDRAFRGRDQRFRAS
jgi:hypothetical protein